MKTVVGIVVIVAIGLVGYLFSRGQSPQQSASSNTKTTLSPTKTPEGAIMNQPKQYSTQPEMKIDKKKQYNAVIKTSKGTMNVQLDPVSAPVTVNNFVFLAREGFYDNTPFHRIMKGFMIQGGDPTGTGRGGPGYRFADEPVTKSYTRGTIAMANAGPNTNGSQFFVMHADYGLPKNYVIFGAVPSGDSASLATLDAIATSPVTTSETGEPSKPTEKILIETVTIEEK